MSEFGGLDLYQGAVRGVRAFDVDQLGRLRGVTHPAVWKPGENESEHARGSALSAAWRSLYGASPPVRVTADPVVSDRPHDFTTCGSCGFYAYYDDESRYASKGRLSAVIEGYGVVHLGTNGFRAQKARVVALYSPGLPEWRRRLDVLARRYPGGMWLQVPAWLTVAAAIGAGSLVEVLGGPASLSWTAFALVMVLALWFFYSSFRSISYEFPSIHPELADGPAIDLVRRNYPDVKIYRSRRAMLRDFPTTRPEVPSPETTEDFWTREVSA